MQASISMIGKVLASQAPTQMTPSVNEGSPRNFTSVLEGATRQLDALRNDAGGKVRGLMMGDGTDIHTAVIATQKADLAFELALATRNKAISAYQQLMAMQF